MEFQQPRPAPSGAQGWGSALLQLLAGGSQILGCDLGCFSSPCSLSLLMWLRLLCYWGLFSQALQGQALDQGSLGWRAGDFRCCPLLLPTKPLVPVEDWPDLARMPGSVGCGWAVPRSNCPSRKNVSLSELFCNPFVISSLGKKAKRSLTIL